MKNKIVSVTLIGKPVSTNTIWRSRVIGGHVSVYMTEEGKAIKQAYALQARIQGRSQAILAPLKGDLGVNICLYFPDNRRRDWDNWHKAICDAMTGVLWEDDSQIIEAHVGKYVDKGNPRVELDVYNC